MYFIGQTSIYLIGQPDEINKYYHNIILISPVNTEYDHFERLQLTMECLIGKLGKNRRAVYMSYDHIRMYD